MRSIIPYFIIQDRLSLCSHISGSEHRKKHEDYQESTEHVEANEVDNGEAAAAGSLLSRVVVGLWIAQLPRQTGQHDLLPGLACGTSNTEQETTSVTQEQNKRLFNMHL